MDIRDKYFNLGKDDGKKWAKNNTGKIEEALKWQPTSGDRDPRNNRCKSAADHFTTAMKNNPELKLEDYDNDISEPLSYYYQGWIEGLNKFLFAFA